MVFQPAADGSGREAEDPCDVVDGDVFLSGHKRGRLPGLRPGLENKRLNLRILKIFMQSVTIFGNRSYIYPL
jgi:hypothetical protein